MLNVGKEAFAPQLAVVDNVDPGLDLFGDDRPCGRLDGLGQRRLCHLGAAKLGRMQRNQRLRSRQAAGVGS